MYLRILILTCRVGKIFDIKMLYLLSLTIVFFLCIFTDLQAKTEEVVECRVTPQIWQLSPSPYINRTNDLRKAAENVKFYQGQEIIIKGIVSDKNCIPISDATVEIWQADSEGNINFSDFKTMLSDGKFLGSGACVTDNLGQYDFITVMPGKINDRRAPHINVRVKHPNFPPFETIMYFADSFSTNKDSVLNNEVSKASRPLLIARSENDLSSNDGYTFDITLDGSNRFTYY